MIKYSSLIFDKSKSEGQSNGYTDFLAKEELRKNEFIKVTGF